MFRRRVQSPILIAQWFFVSFVCSHLSSAALGQTQTETDNRCIYSEQTVECQLLPNKIDSYKIELPRGAVLHVTLEEEGDDLIVGLQRTRDGELIARSDLGNGYGRETITYISEQTDSYLVLVSPASSVIAKYKITMSATPMGVVADSQRIRAERILGDGLRIATGEEGRGGSEAVHKSIAKWQEALQLWNTLGDQYWISYTLMYLGRANHELNRSKEALDYYSQALAMKHAIADNAGEAMTLIEIGRIHSELGEHKEALVNLNKALPFLQKIGDRYNEALAINDIGLEYSLMKDYRQALPSFSQALSLWKALGLESDEANALGNMMHCWLYLGKARLAIFFGKQAINIYQKLRTESVFTPYLQKMFIKSNEHTFRTLAEILIAENRFTEAQRTLNFYKDQHFYDLNETQKPQPLLLGLTPRENAFSKRYQEIGQRLQNCEQRRESFYKSMGVRPPTSQENEESDQLQAELETATNDFERVLGQGETEFGRPTSAEDRLDDVDDTKELQGILTELSLQTKQPAVAVYLSVGEDNLSVLLVTQDLIKGFSLPVKSSTINDKAFQLWALLQSDTYDPSKLARQLYSIIFRAIEERLPKGTRTILWSLDGALRYVPMAVLHDGKQYLIRRYNHVVFTRADKDRLTSLVSRPWTGVGFGTSEASNVQVLGESFSFDRLVGVKDELYGIFRQAKSSRGIIDGDVLPDSEFNKVAMLDALKRKPPLVHIASHFSFRPGEEARSFLLLGDGETMTLTEMKEHTGLFAGVQLLTLSACDTAAQQPDADGREIDGFAELAQRLGAASVIAALWPVADNSTPWLMRDFYQSYESRKGLNKAQALRRAQLDLLNGTAKVNPLPSVVKGTPAAVKIVITNGSTRRNGSNTRASVAYIPEQDAPRFKRDDKKPFAHPYYWAPFILIGNWR